MTQPLFRPLFCVFAFLCVALPDRLAAQKADDEKREAKSDEEKEKRKDKGDDEPAGKIIIEPQAEIPKIPELPKDRLPRRTRTPPDPTTSQYTREPVYIEISERAVPMSGEEYVPRVTVTRNYLAEYFRRAGHPVVETPGEAAFRIEGTLMTEFYKELKFKKRTIAWKYFTSSKLSVTDAAGNVVELSEIPDFYRENVAGEVDCVLDVRRLVAKRHYDRLFMRGKTFTNAKVVDLLQALVVDPIEVDEPLSGNEVVERLADIGLPAVHYLIEAMTNTKTVLADTEYPDLLNLDDLKVYHLADKALEEIFQKVSRLQIASKPYERFVIIRGWENEWRRFCPPFRDSPNSQRRGARATERKSG